MIWGLLEKQPKMFLPEIQSRYPDIPWRLMRDMRNVVFHEYF